MNRERENLKAGVFVLIGGVLAVIVVFVLTDFGQLLEQKRPILVFFELGNGLHGLKTGAPVTLGDQSIGDVTEIRDKFESGNNGAMRVVGKVVTARIPKRYDLYQNAVIELKAPLIGSGTSLNIRSVGEGRLYGGNIAIEGSVAGNAQVQELVRETGIQEQQREQIRRIITSIESIAATLEDDVPRITGQVKEILTHARTTVIDLQQTVADAREVAGVVKHRYAVWLERVDRITESADRSLSDIHDLVMEKTGQVRDMVDTLHHITDVASEKTMVQVTEALDVATDALTSLKTAAKEIRSLVAGQRPVLAGTLANARLTSDQLKLAAIEIRRSPWRLLYEPDDKELSTDNLYDAARSFALAAGLLDSTAQKLHGLSTGGGGLDDPGIRKMVEHLEAVFAKFREAETKFWDAIAEVKNSP